VFIRQNAFVSGEIEGLTKSSGTTMSILGVLPQGDFGRRNQRRGPVNGCRQDAICEVEGRDHVEHRSGSLRQGRSTARFAM